MAMIVRYRNIMPVSKREMRTIDGSKVSLGKGGVFHD